MTSTEERITALAREAARHAPRLRLLVLFGSRGRGDAHAASDWDLGYLAEPSFDPLDLSAALVELLGTEAVDLVDLDSANGLLRFRVARDGRPLFDAGGEFEAFWLASVRFWCDAGPILDAGYEELLRELPS